MNFQTIEHYDNLSDYVAKATSTKKAHRHGAWDDNTEFRGTSNMNESVKIANEGYELDKLNAALDGIKSNEAYELEQVFDVSGGEVEMGRYMEGTPECMLDFTMIEAKKFVHLVIGVVEAGRTTDRQILNRAAGICSLVDNLENDNYRVRLSIAAACEGIAGSNKNAITIVDIKDYKEPLAVTNLAGVLHTGFFRRIIWSWLEGVNANASYGVGSTSVASAPNSIDGIKKSGAVTDSFVYLPSISEKQGGTAGLRGGNFQEYKDAEAYAKDVQDKINTGELMVSVS